MTEDIENKVKGSGSRGVDLSDLPEIEPPQTEKGEFSFKRSLVRPEKKGCMSVLGVLGGIGVGISYFGPSVYETFAGYFSG